MAEKDTYPIPDEVRGAAEPVRIRMPGIRFWMGRMKAISAVLPIRDVIQLSADTVLYREDYRLRSKVPGNRLVRSEWVDTIKKGIRQNADRLLLGTFIFAVSPDGVSCEKGWPEPESGEPLLDVDRWGLRSGHKLFILDAQHRSRALQRLWEETVTAVAAGGISSDEVSELLKRSSVPIVVVLETDERQIRRMFVTMASTRPIPTALVVAMDEFRPVNRLGIMVAERSTLLSNGGPAGRLEYQTGTPKADKVYTAAVVRAGASISLIGFKDRTPTQRDENLEKALREFGTGTLETQVDRASNWIAEAWNYAAMKVPGWKLIVEGKNTPDEVRNEYLVGSGAALYVVAGVLAACRSAAIDYKPAFDAVAELPWRKRDTQQAKDPVTGERSIEHKFFEGLLVNSRLVKSDDGSSRAVYGTAGGNRTQYQGATRKVLDYLAQDTRFSRLKSPTVLETLGLVATGRRGRPRLAA